MGRVLTVIVVVATSVLVSGCMHVPILWPLKVEAETSAATGPAKWTFLPARAGGSA
jgi:hypothetical protein